MIDSLNQFHFIRPIWLLCLCFIPFVWLFLTKYSGTSNDWKNVIHPDLLKHLTPKRHHEQQKTPVLLVCLIIFISSIAISGPSWKQKPSPVFQSGDDLVIILDLSLSVLATDVSPDRLTKAKQKLQDLLSYRKEGNTALIVFSGDAHVVTPLTDDIQTILANMKALDPFIMPVIGSRPDKAVQLALELFNQSKSQNPRLVMLTDGVEENQISQIFNDLNDFQSPPSLSILALGTAQGGPIAIPGQGYLKDKGQVILPKTNFDDLERLAKKTGGHFSKLTLDDSDLNQINITKTPDSLNKRLENEDKNKRFFDVWEDMGYVILLFLIPLVLFSYRKNILPAALLFIIFPSDRSYALDWKDLWQTKDQQAEIILNEGDPAAAADVFTSEKYKAYSYFKSGKYEEAADLFQKQSDIQSKYNAGNALAKQNKYAEALSKYEDVLAINPEHEDARHNKAIIEELLKQQQNQDQQNQDQQNQDQQNQEQQNQEQQNQEQQNQDQQNQEQQNQDQQNQDQQNQDQQNQDQQNQDQQNQDQQNQDQQNQDQHNQDQQNQDQHNQDQQNQELSDEERQAQEQQQKDQDKELEELKQQALKELEEKQQLSDEEQQSYEQWMRRVPDDPGALLRRKFEQQAQERARIKSNVRKEGEPIW